MDDQSQNLAACIYAYCVTAETPALGAIRGAAAEEKRTAQADSLLWTIPGEGLVAVVKEVALTDWVGASGDANLADLSWLGPRAVEHELVIARIMAAGPVLPLRLGSLFSSEQVLRDWLAAERQAIWRFLRETGKKLEFSLKGWLDLEQAAQSLAASGSGSEALPLTPGARYLREQRRKQELLAAGRRWGRQLAPQLTELLAPLGVQSRPLSVRSSSTGGRREELAFHLALLVPDDRTEALASLVSAQSLALQPAGMELALSGPWPLYSFCPQLAGTRQPSPQVDVL